MATILLWTSLIGFALPFAASIECFECFSRKSMKDCMDLQKVTSCPRNAEYCRNMTVGVYVRMVNENMIGYQRGCASQDECVFKRCTGHFAKAYGEKEDAYNSCQMSCCQGNLCPQGNATTAATKNPLAGARGGSDSVNLASFSVSLGALMSIISAFFL